MSQRARRRRQAPGGKTNAPLRSPRAAAASNCAIRRGKSVRLLDERPPRRPCLACQREYDSCMWNDTMLCRLHSASHGWWLALSAITGDFHCREFLVRQARASRISCKGMASHSVHSSSCQEQQYTQMTIPCHSSAALGFAQTCRLAQSLLSQLSTQPRVGDAPADSRWTHDNRLIALCICCSTVCF